MPVSSPLALLSAAAVVLAGAALLVSDPPDDRPARASATVSPERSDRPAASSATRSTGARPAPRRPRHTPHVVRRSATYVEVFNNSGIGGLAGSTAARAAEAGWKVIGSDNWYGTIAASTVYYPAGERPEARLLAEDLGIARTKPLIAPMRGDRLTVILTSDYR